MAKKALGRGLEALIPKRLVEEKKGSRPANSTVPNQTQSLPAP